VRIFAFHCGGDRAPRSVYDPLDDDPGSIVYGPYYFFLVDHPSGWVLFDTGCHPKWAVAAHEEGALSVEVREEHLVPAQLAALGLEPSDVEHVVVSHLHFDHAGGLRYFPHARVYVNERELPFAYRPAVYQRAFYDRDDFDHPLQWIEVGDSYDLFGDSSIRLIATPGHTPGHQSMLVELTSGLHVLAADVSYWTSKMRERRLPGILWNPDEMVRSWGAVEELERTRQARLVFTHDPEDEDRKPVAPDEWYA